MEGSGDPILSDEHQNAKWASIEEALTINLDPYLSELLSQQKNT